MSDVAVTNKPMSTYEPFVGLVADCMANGFAMVAEREFLASLDRSVPLPEAFKDHARSFIKWRGAFIIDRISPAGECRGGLTDAQVRHLIANVELLIHDIEGSREDHAVLAPGYIVHRLRQALAVTEQGTADQTTNHETGRKSNV